jgi:hypothetical protein
VTTRVAKYQVEKVAKEAAEKATETKRQQKEVEDRGGDTHPMETYIPNVSTESYTRLIICKLSTHQNKNGLN